LKEVLVSFDAIRINGPCLGASKNLLAVIYDRVSNYFCPECDLVFFLISYTAFLIMRTNAVY
jgi:hypothetical protein